MATTIRMLEHTFRDAGLLKEVTETSVIEASGQELVRVAALVGAKRVFDVAGVRSRAEAVAVLKLSRQPQPKLDEDPEGWGSVEAIRKRVFEVPLPRLGKDTEGRSLKDIVRTAMEE